MSFSTQHKICYNKCFGSGNFSIIHGPRHRKNNFTLIGLIRELALKQKNFGFCASSNHATDLFALKVHGGRT